MRHPGPPGCLYFMRGEIVVLSTICLIVYPENVSKICLKSKRKRKIFRKILNPSYHSPPDIELIRDPMELLMSRYTKRKLMIPMHSFARKYAYGFLSSAIFTHP